MDFVLEQFSRFFGYTVKNLSYSRCTAFDTKNQPRVSYGAIAAAFHDLSLVHEDVVGASCPNQASPVLPALSGLLDVGVSKCEKTAINSGRSIALPERKLGPHHSISQCQVANTRSSPYSGSREGTTKKAGDVPVTLYNTRSDSMVASTLLNSSKFRSSLRPLSRCRCSQRKRIYSRLSVPGVWYDLMHS